MATRAAAHNGQQQWQHCKQCDEQLVLAGSKHHAWWEFSLTVAITIGQLAGRMEFCVPRMLFQETYTSPQATHSTTDDPVTSTKQPGARCFWVNG
jgi:hypothetical protein